MNEGEITLDEYMSRLPSCHSAYKEYQKLRDDANFLAKLQAAGVPKHVLRKYNGEVLSWMTNYSIFWVIFYGIIGWIYVIYWLFIHE